jgi:hypothetical protein
MATIELSDIGLQVGKIDTLQDRLIKAYDSGKDVLQDRLIKAYSSRRISWRTG